jgi:hypothetical protein
MKVLIRKTIAGNEYWDADGKKTLFVPKGQTPDFEVEENPESMLVPEVEEIEVSENSLEGMSIKELREYAAEHDIEIPAEVKKLKEIKEFLLSAE